MSLHPTLAQETSVEAARIRQVLLDTFDKPETRLSVDPIVSRGDFAVAGWAQGERDGRALLRRKSDGWAIVMCSGDALKTPERLTHAGVPVAQARVLANDLAVAERSLDPARLAKFSSFQEDVVMEEGSHHPPVGHHH